MYKPVPLYLGLRYFASSGHSGFLVSFISLLAIFGLVVGVALLIIVFSVMNGFDKELKTRILGAVPHVQVIHKSGAAGWREDRELIAALPGIVEVTPYNHIDGLAFFRNKTEPLQLIGLSAEFTPVGLQSVLQDAGLALPQPGEVLLSGTVATQLQIEMGQTLTIINATQGATGSSVHALRLAGVFYTHTELDRNLAIADIEEVATLSGIPGLVQGFRVQLADEFAARDIGFEILRVLPYGYSFRDWFQTHGNLYEAIKMSRNLVGLLVFLVIAIAAFNVVSMLIMTVVDRRRDVAILQTLGLSRGQVMRVFLTQGSMIGLFGIVIGVALGVAGCAGIARLVACIESTLGFKFLNTAIYPIDYVPVDLRTGDLIMIIVTAVVLNLLATIYPALRASRVRPAEELRYE